MNIFPYYLQTKVIIINFFSSILTIAFTINHMVSFYALLPLCAERRKKWLKKLLPTNQIIDWTSDLPIPANWNIFFWNLDKSSDNNCKASTKFPLKFVGEIQHIFFRKSFLKECLFWLIMVKSCNIPNIMKHSMSLLVHYQEIIGKNDVGYPH